MPTCTSLTFVPGGAVEYAVCPDSPRPYTKTCSDERTCCMREPVGECHPFGCDRMQ